MLFLIIIVILSNPVLVSESARILAYFPLPSISHQMVFRSLTLELAKRGHEVVVLTTDPGFSKEEVPGNLTEIDLHDQSYSKWKEFLSVTASGKETDALSVIEVATQVLAKTVEAQIQTDEVQMLINDPSQKFDLLLLEACTWYPVAFFHIFKAPVIHISSFGSFRGNYESVGAPVHPILYPEMQQLLHHKLYNLTIWDKLQKLRASLKIQSLYEESDYIDNQCMKKSFGPHIPDCAELKKNVDMLFINYYTIWQDNRPLPLSVNLMGGIHIKLEKALPEDWKVYLDNSKYGAIYVSLGTNVDTSLLPTEKVQVMLKVFSKLPYDILLKWNSDKLPGKPKNVRISEWFPQSDLLRHPKIKLFITQGGLQSTDEAILAGVPLIGIPMVGDQWYNVEKYVKHNIGMKLDMDSLNAEAFERAINTVIDDKSFKNNVIHLRSIIQDQPQTPLERAVWWVEYVLRHGGARHLRAPAANISWVQYFELELVLVTLICLLSALIFVLSMAYFAYVLCFWGSKVERAREKDE